MFLILLLVASYLVYQYLILAKGNTLKNLNTIPVLNNILPKTDDRFAFASEIRNYSIGDSDKNTLDNLLIEWGNFYPSGAEIYGDSSFKTIKKIAVNLKAQANNPDNFKRFGYKIYTTAEPKSLISDSLVSLDKESQVLIIDIFISTNFLAKTTPTTVDQYFNSHSLSKNDIVNLQFAYLLFNSSSASLTRLLHLQSAAEQQTLVRTEVFDRVATWKQTNKYPIELK